MFVTTPVKISCNQTTAFVSEVIIAWVVELAITSGFAVRENNSSYFQLLAPTTSSKCKALLSLTSGNEWHTRLYSRDPRFESHSMDLRISQN